MQKYFKSLANGVRFFESHSHQPKVPRTDLLKDEDLDKYRKWLNSQPKEIDRTFATYTWLPKISLLYNQTLTKFIATTFSSAKMEAVSDIYIPPKIHENAIHVYSAPGLASAYRFTRSVEIVFGAFLLVKTSFPIYFAAVAGLAYFLGGNAFIYEPTRRTVIRMDLLPHTKQVSIQKIGAFGRILTKLVKIEDLEKVEFDSLAQKENYFWNLNYNRVDAELIFKDKTTGELLLFAKTGLWDKEALAHPFLN